MPVTAPVTEFLRIDTSAPTQLLDITERVGKVVRDTGIRNGIVQVMTLHTTAAIRLGESEPGLLQDIADFFNKLAPPEAGYRHDLTPVDDRKNAHGHIAAFLLGASEGMAVRDGRLLLGAWQKIFFVELDGPRCGREVVVTVVGK